MKTDTSDIFDHPDVNAPDEPAMQPTPGGSKFVMCRPEFLSTKIGNNVFMSGDKKEPADVPRALNQHDRCGHVLEALGVELFEMPPAKGC